MRILVVKLSSLGDLFHALPAVAQIKSTWNAEIHWVTQPAYRELVGCFEPVDRVIAFPRRDFARNAGTFLRELRRHRYDFVLDMQGLMKSALVARATRARRRIGPSFHREGARLLYQAIAGTRNKERHAVEENLDFVDFLGMERSKPAFPVHWPQPRDLPDGLNIALLPCSRWVTKNWPPEYFAELCGKLPDAAHLHVFGGAEDAATGEAICAGAERAVKNHCGKTSLVELGGYLAAMDLVITVDSGPMHMAAAAGTPVLALFGPTDARRTGPYGDAHRILSRDDLACRPCFSRACKLPEADIRCLRGISAGRVAAVAKEMLAAGG